MAMEDKEKSYKIRVYAHTMIEVYACDNEEEAKDKACDYVKEELSKNINDYKVCAVRVL